MPAIEPAAMPAPAIEPAAMPAPAIEPAQQHSTRKCKRDWRLPIKKDEVFETEYDKINEVYLTAKNKLLKTINEDSYLTEFGMPGIIRHEKQRHN